MKKLILIAIAVLILIGCATTKLKFFTDARNGQTYKTVSYEDPLLGTKITIMAENLNYKIAGSYAYDDNEQYRKNLGLLYTWEAAMKACPSGWHLPSDSEWSRLIELIGSEDTVGYAMKSIKGWVKNGNYGNGTNSSGFNAISAGSRYDDGTFYGIGVGGYFWSSTEGVESSAWGRSLSYDSSEASRSSYGSKGYAFSCRCVRD